MAHADINYWILTKGFCLNTYSVFVCRNDFVRWNNSTEQHRQEFSRKFDSIESKSESENADQSLCVAFHYHKTVIISFQYMWFPSSPWMHHVTEQEAPLITAATRCESPGPTWVQPKFSQRRGGSLVWRDWHHLSLGTELRINRWVQHVRLFIVSQVQSEGEEERGFLLVTSVKCVAVFSSLMIHQMFAGRLW